MSVMSQGEAAGDVDNMILTSDHNDTDSSSSAQLNGWSDLLTRGIQHTNAANKGQVSLGEDGRKGGLYRF